MKKQPLIVLSILLLSSCNNVLNQDTINTNNKESLSSFDTKALTVSYLKKKLDKWVATGNGKKMLRELEYAKFKHIDVLKEVINSQPDSYAYYQGLKSFIQVTTKENYDVAFKSFIDNLSPDPSFVTTLQASDITNTSFTANWSTVTNATGYMLIVDNGTPIDVGNVTSKNITGLSAGSTHSYVVKSVNEGGTSEASSSVNVTLIPTEPIASDVTNLAQTSFTANWGSVIGATSYKLFVDGISVYTGSSTSCNVTSLEVGSSHNYYVQAINAGGTSASSNTINLTLNPAIAGVPVATSATDITQTSFTANWTSVSGATSYKLFIDDVEAYSGTNLNFSKTGLTVGTNHTYYVQAINISGASANSNAISLTLNPAIPSSPVASVATDITTTSFTANWATVTDATSYKLFIDDVESYSGTNLNFSKTGLTANSAHTYYVQAINISGASANSNVVNVRTVSVAPVASDATNITTTSFTANWATVTGATSYKLYLDGTPITLGDVSSYNATGLTKGTSHTYYVQAVNSGGSSVNSNTISLFTIFDEFKINSFTMNGQQNLSIGVADDGSFVVTWQSYGQDGDSTSERNIYAQKYNANGSTNGSEFLVNTYTTNEQGMPSVAMAYDGKFIISWHSHYQDGSEWGVYAQRYNADGSKNGSEFLVNTCTTNNQIDPSIAMADDGKFVISWYSYGQDGDSSSNYNVYAQKYNANGSKNGSEFLVNTYTTNNQPNPSIALADDGRFVVTWEGQGTEDTYGIYAQRYNADGSKNGSEYLVNTYTTNSQLSPSIAMADDGKFIITWYSQAQDGSGYGIYAQRYNTDGSTLGSEFRVNSFTTGDQSDPSIAMSGDGNFIISWNSVGQDSSLFGVYAQRYNANGTPNGSEFLVNTYVNSNQNLSSTAITDNGKFIISWQSYAQDGNGYGIFGKRYDNLGNIL